MERLRVPAPPYERFMLAARTIHEWGHLAAAAGWIPVASERRTDYERMAHELADGFEEIYRDAPGVVRAHTAGEMTRLTSHGLTVGAALARIAMNRFPDYQANLLARRYLSLAERETYMRNNVYSLALEYPSTQVFLRLARYAYEYQYLRFSGIGDAWTYFLSSTWCGDEYIQRRIVSTAQLRRLFETVGKLCDCFAVDESKFRETDETQ
jgi:hypothetical protein